MVDLTRRNVYALNVTLSPTGAWDSTIKIRRSIHIDIEPIGETR